MWVWKSDPQIKYELIFIYTNNIFITTGNFLTTNYCQVMSFSPPKNMYVYFSKVNVTMYSVCIATKPPAKRDCQFGHYGLCQSAKVPKVPGL